MKHRALTAIALCLVATELAAQTTPPPAARPVERTQAAENQATVPTPATTRADPNPSPQPVAAAPVTAAVPANASAATSKSSAKPPVWDVMQPRGLKTREVALHVDEGSWMNVDVSPDGRLIAFDLLGDLYTMPITGGTPRQHRHRHQSQTDDPLHSIPFAGGAGRLHEQARHWCRRRAGIIDQRTPATSCGSIVNKG